MTQVCSVCFHENPEGVIFCEACGVELTPVASTPLTTPPVIEEKPSLPSPPVIEEKPLLPSPPVAENPSLPSPPVIEEPILPPLVVEEKPPLPPPVVEPTQQTKTTTIIQEEPPTLLISKNPGSPVPQFPLEGTNILIGRFDPDIGPVEIDLEGFPGEDTISRNHAEIYFEGGCWKIKDLGSVNGVFIKKAGQPRYGPRITSPEIISTGDEVSIAKIRFLLQ